MPLRKECPNTEVFLVRVFQQSDQKKLRIWTLFTQFVVDFIAHIECCIVFIVLPFSGV